MKTARKFISLLLVLIICFTAAPMTFAQESAEYTQQEATTEITATEAPEEETTTEETTTEAPEEETTTEETTTEETTTEASEEETTTEETITEATEEETTTEETTTEAPEEETEGEDKSLGDNDIVATLYIFHDQSDIHVWGHTWIYVENLTDQELRVGVYTLLPGEGVSVGTLPEYDGWGVYYNIEAYQQGIYGMEGQLSMKDEITLRELRRVSNFIVNYINFWDPVFFNCMLFAFLAWDMGSSRILIPLIFPIIGKLQMLIYSHETGALMKPVTIDKVYRQTGMAGWAKLEPYTP